MDQDPILDHDALLTLARKTEGAARDHDPDRIETHALHLFQALVEHLLAERSALLQVAPAQARLLERGQQRVVDLVVELAATAASDPDECDCDQVAANLLAELTLQVGDERQARLADGRA